MYSRNGTSAVYESTLSSGTWSTSNSVCTLTAAPRWIAARICPTRDEVAYAALDQSSDSCIWFKIGTTHSTPVMLTTSAPTASSRSLAVAYEQSSGDCLVVYADSTFSTPCYRTGSNGTLSAQSQISGMASGSPLRLLQLYAKPGTDEVLLLGAATDGKLWACIWSGSSWGAPTILTNTLSSTSSECFSAVYLPNGQAAAVYSASGSNTVTIRTLALGIFSLPYALTGIGTDPRIIKIATSPISSSAVVGVLGTNGNLYSYTYNGVSVAAPITVASGIGTTTSRAFDVAWQPNGAKAIVMYTKGSAAPSWRTFDGTSWTSEVSAGNLRPGKNIQVISLTPGSTGTDIYAMCANNNIDLWTMTWSGTTFSSAVLIDGNMGGSPGDEPWQISESLFSAKPKLTSWQQANP
jgi:hypothetical protein